MSLSQNIKKLRLEKGLTQEQLADRLGVSAQAVSKWETSDTYPDGALLAPLAQALGSSLDKMFDNTAVSMYDISSRVLRMIQKTDGQARFHIARDICWQIQRGLFFCGVPSDEAYEPCEQKNGGLNSYIVNDFGFSHISNGNSPFFAVFPRYGDCYADAIGDGEQMRKVFAALASPDTMRAVIFLHGKERNYVFEGEFLADSCGISADRLDGVLDDLSELRITRKKEVRINGEPHALYYSSPSHLMIALLLLAGEFGYRGGYCLHAENIERPFL